ncbi:PRC-barrel domain-containing protein [Alkalihalobacillus trypoxylicola]|uniref:PRC-barrel domain-containing protein n=1 Tax=Alkalihalobacillus trypoxylicola TaxID=519424 RepID=A0A162E6P1_9BACI|nr:PRC-barrel domain-containing protein [Alkalihalobacillus trypoxylicola]KYG31892.1 hypothetical protein AZF04_03705 [Alkalihalobacillus trypoxylicola]
MRTFSMVEGLPVIHSHTGKEYGAVLDLILEEGKVHSLLINKKGWFNQHITLPIKAIDSLGMDGIMIKEENYFHPYTKRNRHRLHLKRGKERIYGKLLLSSEGEKLGLVEDVYFQEELGTITGYEVTDGLLADLVEGRKVIVHNKALIVGKERAILSR